MIAKPIYTLIGVLAVLVLLGPIANATVEKKETAQIVRSPYSLEGKAFSDRKIGDRLSGSAAARYGLIFALQDAGDLKKANEEIGRLKDYRLMGYVFYQRYMLKNYTATFRELADWMRQYGDYPNADKIHALAVMRHPAGAVLAEPKGGKGLSAYHDDDTGQPAKPYISTQNSSPKERDILADIERRLSKSPTSALAKLDSAPVRRLFDATEYDAIAARIAESFFYNGKADRAHALAAAAAKRSGKEVPLAGWIAGLSAWRMGHYSDAAAYFERAAQSPRASAWMIAAAAHWAARSHLRNHAPQKVSHWLRVSAEYPRSFYGIISTKALGMEQTRFHWKLPDLRHRLVKALADVPAGRRALALMDAGQIPLAAEELRQIDPSDDTVLQEAMMAAAHAAGAPALEMRLGSMLKDPDGNLYDAALYPDSPWPPEDGYEVDKSLLHALIRQESKFNVTANNKDSGAAGLMQIMPATAKIIGNRHDIPLDAELLQDPSTNIRLGQKYLADLLKDSNVNGNLFKLAVAYNAGPGKLARWEKELDYKSDALLFIESIPVAETRAFVERVLTNYWIYRLKYGLDTDSLEKVAAGDWPFYAP